TAGPAKNNGQTAAHRYAYLPDPGQPLFGLSRRWSSRWLPKVARFGKGPGESELPEKRGPVHSRGIFELSRPSDGDPPVGRPARTDIIYGHARPARERRACSGERQPASYAAAGGRQRGCALLGTVEDCGGRWQGIIYRLNTQRFVS